MRLPAPASLARHLGQALRARLPRIPAPRWLWVLNGLLAAAFVVVDLARATHDLALRPWQIVLGLLLVAGVFAALRQQGRRLQDLLGPTALALLLLGVFVDHPRVLQSDGFLYYSYLRSLLFDADLSLRNDFILLGPTVRPEHVNASPVGTPLCWAPLVLVLHVAWNVSSLFGAPRPLGVEPAYQAAACLATLIYGAAALFLLYALLRRWTSRTLAFFVTLLCWWATPLRFYLSAQPSLAHGCEFFAAVLVLRTSFRLRDGVTRRRVLAAGAAAGLLLLIRTQHGLLLLLPAAEVLAGVDWRRERRRAALGLLALGAAFAVTALPQVLVWQAMFGRPITLPYTALHGSSFMRLDQPQIAGALISPRGGILTSYPATVAGLAGLLTLLAWGSGLWRRDRPGLPGRRFAAVALIVFAGGLYVNASVFDWFHVRRYTGLMPLLAPGLALVLGPLARGGLVGLAALAFLLLRYDMELDALRGRQGDPAPVRAVLQRLPDGLAYDAYRLGEPWAPRLSASLLAAYTGEVLLDAPVTRLDLGAQGTSLDLPRRPRNLSQIELEEGRPCRWVRGDGATLYLALERARAFTLSVHARALETAEAQTIEAFWNDTRLGQKEMVPRWEAYRFSVPLETVRAGTNSLELRFSRSPVFRRVRGSGPREVRPAALARLDFHLSTAE